MEQELVEWLKKRLGPHPALRLGIGDDAAVVDLGGSTDCVVTVDAVMDSVDFEVAKIDARRAGHKALAVNLSDLAAMAAQPVAAVVALVLPRQPSSCWGLADSTPGTPAQRVQLGSYELAVRLFEGMLPLAERHGVAIAGGDTNTWDGPLVISITALGRPGPSGVWRRDGARAGDQILVTGSFGGSLAGRHLDFEPRVREALLLAERYEIHAAIDVSDGLSLDLSRLAEASGCGAAVDLDRVPIADAARELARTESDGRTALERALADGEDFELVLAAPPDVAGKIIADQPLAISITRIGEIVRDRGLWQIAAGGKLKPLSARGYLHRSSATLGEAP
jgi:thiamine-monophosphate kinase